MSGRGATWDTSSSPALPSSRKPDAPHDGPKYLPKRYAVKLDPPCIFLEYEDANGKRRVRAVKVNNVQPGTDVDRLTRKVIRSFPRKLDTTAVKYAQVHGLVTKLVERVQLLAQQRQQQQQQAAAAAAALAAPPVLPESHRSVSPDRAAAIRVGSAALRGQMEVMGSVDSLERFSTSTAGEDGARSDEDDPEALWRELDALGGGGAGSARPSKSTRGPSRLAPADAAAQARGVMQSSAAADAPASSRSSSAHSTAPPAPPQTTPMRRDSSTGAGSGRSPAPDVLCLGPDVDGETDLNKVSEVELKLAKLRMDSAFKKNQLKPGDPGYEYDKRVEFEPAAAAPNEWDDSDNDDGGGAAAEVSASDDGVEVDWDEIANAVARRKQ